MPLVRQGAMPPVAAIKMGATDIQNVKFGTVDVWLRALLRDDFNDSTVTNLGPNWTDYGPAVAPYQAMVDPGGYARCNIPDTGLIAPGVAVQTSRWRYNASVAPNDDAYLEVKIGPMGTWLPQYISRAYLRGSNAAFSDGVGLAVSSSGRVQISTLIGNTETLIDVPNANCGSGDVLRLTPSNRQFVITKNGRWLGQWTDTTNATAKGLANRSVLASFMGSKDGPIGVRHFSPGFDYIECGGGVNGISTAALGHGNYTWTSGIPVRPGTDYAPVAGDLVLAFITNTEPGRSFTMPAGWNNLLGTGTTVISSTGNTAAAIWHLVTDAEAQAGTNSWPMGGFWTAQAYGGVYALVLRGVDPAAPIAAVASGTGPGGSNPHVLPGIAAGSITKDRSVVIGWLGSDTPIGYLNSGTPFGWTQKATEDSGQGGWWGWAGFDTEAVYQRDALTQSGVPVLSANVIPGSSNAYCAVTVAVAVKPNT